MTSFYEITVFFSDNPKLIERGENHLKSSHLQSFFFDPDSEQMSGKIHASLRDAVYSTQVSFKNGKILNAYCTCAKGKHKCSHMATLMLHSLYSCSSTDKPCAWNRPKTAAASVTMEDIFVTDKFVALKRKPNDEDKSFLQSALSSSSFTGLHWILTPEPNISPNEYPVLTVDELIILCESETVQDKVNFVIENLKLTNDDIKAIFSATIGQRKNYLWGQFRKGRLTASNFGLVLRAIEKNTIPPSLIKTLKGEYFIDNAKSVQWGIVHEKDATLLYEDVKGTKIEQVGLYLHPNGQLGCSPDGVIGDMLIEVKCPFSKANTDLLKIISEGKWFVKYSGEDVQADMCEKDGIKVYIFTGNGLIFNLKNKQGYSYYHQVQGMMHIMNKMSCDFVIWSPNMSLIFNILKDPTWYPNMEKLMSFYKNVFIYTFLK